MEAITLNSNSFRQIKGKGNPLPGAHLTTEQFLKYYRIHRNRLQNNAL